MYFKHLLLTRFAVRFEPQEPHAKFEKDPEWMQRRFELFERYTLPSVKAQTNKDFVWILLADEAFENIDAERLHSYGIDIAWLHNVYWDLYNFEDIIRDYSKEYEWVITSRLDSDDMICRTYIEDTQNAFDYQKSWLSYERGYMIKGDRAYPRRFPNSPFVSYIEPARLAQGVYHITHMKAGYDAPLVVFKDKPGWIQVDHGGNIKNNVERKKLVDWVPVSSLKAQFGGIE